MADTRISMKRLLIFSLVLFLTVNAFAILALISTEELLAKTDLVVVATLSKVGETTKKDTVSGTGVLTVTEVLEGKATAGQNLTLSWAYNKHIICPRIDHSSQNGKTNIWLLQKTTNNTFTANYPGRVMELKQRAELEKAMKK